MANLRVCCPTTITLWINRVQYQPFTIGSCTLWSPAALIQPLNRIHQQFFFANMIYSRTTTAHLTNDWRSLRPEALFTSIAVPTMSWTPCKRPSWSRSGAWRRCRGENPSGKCWFVAAAWLQGTVETAWETDGSKFGCIFFWDSFGVFDSICMSAKILEAPPGTATGRDVKLQEEELPLGVDMRWCSQLSTGLSENVGYIPNEIAI